MSSNLPPVADYSYLSQLQECRRKHFYAAELGLTEAERVPVLKAGTALHDGLETLYKTEWNLEEAEASLRASWGDYVIPQARDKSFLNADHLCAVLRRYAEHYADEPREIVKTADELFGERTFVLDWDGITVGGRVDLVQETTDGQLYLVDFKTTTGWLNSWWASRKSFEIDHQLRIYTAAIQEELGVTLAGAYINALYMGEKADDPEEKWNKRKSSRFRLFGPYSFSPAMLEETHAWIEAGLDEIEYRRGLDIGDRDEYAWPQNTANRYGCGKCEFEAVCSANPKVRDGLIEHRYVERELTGRLASGADSDE